MNNAINTHEQKKSIVPNAIQFKGNLITSIFWDYFCYIDKASYTIDEILSEYQIPVKFLNMEFGRPDSPYRVCFLKCCKRYTPFLSTIVFPRLHQDNTKLDGNKYIQACKEIINDALQYLKGESVE